MIFLCLFCAAFAGKNKPDEGSLLYLVLMTLSLHGPILLATATLLRVYDLTWNQAFGFSKQPVARAIFRGAIAALLFLPVGMVLQVVSIKLLEWLHFATPQEAAVEAFGKTVSRAAQIYLAFFSIVLAPFVEEVFFRGTLFSLMKRLGHPFFAYTGSALFFAAVHLNAPTFAPLFVLGLLLAWLYASTGNLLASFTAHALFNTINVVWLLFGERLGEMLEHRFHLQ